MRKRSCSYYATQKRLISKIGPAKNQICAYCGDPAQVWAYLGGAPDERVDQINSGKKMIDIKYSEKPAFYEPQCRTCFNSMQAAK